MEWKSAQERERSWPSADISMNSQKLQEVTNFKYQCNPLQGWYMLSGNLYQDCLSNGQTKQDLEVHHHQLRKQVQAVKVSCYLHPRLWLWNMDLTCWLWKKRILAVETNCLRKLLRMFFGAQDQRLGAEQDQLPCWSTGTSSGKCQETETCMVRACHTPRQPLKNHPPWHLRGRATPWSAKEILDGQHQRVHISAQWLPAEKIGRVFLLNRLSCASDDPISQGTELNRQGASFHWSRTSQNLWFQGTVPIRVATCTWNVGSDCWT